MSHIPPAAKAVPAPQLTSKCSQSAGSSLEVMERKVESTTEKDTELISSPGFAMD